MNKGILSTFVFVGGLVGSYLPVILFNVDGFSPISILGGVIGGIVGIWAAWKFRDYF